MDCVIETKQLTIGYHGVSVIEQIHFQLKPHQICCLLGANGVGKSTFIKTLLGIQPPLSGDIYFQNRPLATWNKMALAKQMAYVPQAHQSMFAFSVLEMVLMGRSAYFKWYQTPRPVDKAIAFDALETMQIAHLAQRLYSELSGGEKQLVLIARAIAQDAQVLIMDEPTSNLDFGNQIRLLEKINGLRSQQRSLIISSHSPQQVNYLTTAQDSIVIFNNQSTPHFEQGDKKTMLNLSKLAHIYRLSPEQLQQHLHLSENNK